MEPVTSRGISGTLTYISTRAGLAELHASWEAVILAAGKVILAVLDHEGPGYSADYYSASQ